MVTNTWKMLTCLQKYFPSSESMKKCNRKWKQCLNESCIFWNVLVGKAHLILKVSVLHFWLCCTLFKFHHSSEGKSVCRRWLTAGLWACVTEVENHRPLNHIVKLAGCLENETLNIQCHNKTEQLKRIILLALQLSTSCQSSEELL